MSKHYTPLRYPGGKSKLTPLVKDILKLNQLSDGEYVEPYAGGAGVALELLLCGHVSRIHLNDLNYPLHAFWRCVVESPEALCRRISTARLSVTAWDRHRRVLANHKNHDLIEVGFAFLFLNRTNRSGIISGGIIGGRAQQGEWKIDARFGRGGLIERIERIASFSSQISLYNMDATKFLDKVGRSLPPRSFIYLDPPYFVQGGRLYDNFYDRDDHASVAKHVSSIKVPWMVSYDDVPDIRKMYRRYRQSSHYLQYSAADAYVGKEALIFSPRLKVPSYIQIERSDVA